MLKLNYSGVHHVNETVFLLSLRTHSAQSICTCPTKGFQLGSRRTGANPSSAGYVLRCRTVRISAGLPSSGHDQVSVAHCKTCLCRSCTSSSMELCRAESTNGCATSILLLEGECPPN